MVEDRRERRPPAVGDDPDHVDFAWLGRLAGRLRGRMFPVTAGTAHDTAEPAPAEPEPAGVDERTGPGEGGTFAERFAAKREEVLQWKYLIPAAMVVIIGMISIHNWFGGIDWGDDFALYLHQAKALTIGNIGEVLHQTRFSIDNSGWHTFSPYAYPWGWPLLLAPFYTVFGLNYTVFKFLEVVAFGGFLLAFFAIVRRRTGLAGATIIVGLIAVSRSFNGATDSVLSDLPYLCFAGLTLWYMDRLRERQALFTDRRALIVLGLLMAFTRNIRREGIALVVALLALQVALLAGTAVRDRSRGWLRGLNWRNVALPYGTFAAATISFQLVLPGPILANLPGTGRASVSPNIKYYADILAEHIGLKDPGVAMQLFHSETAARFALGVFFVFAVIGFFARVLYRLEEDAHLAVFLGCSVLIILAYPYHDGRYLFTITPLLVYFAYQALPAIAAIVNGENRMLGRIAAVLPAVGLVGLIMLCATDLGHAYNYHRYYHYTVDGPESPENKEMFAAVKALTREDDVILFARARAMTFYTDRLAIQGSNLDLLLPRSDWYVMDRTSDYAQTPLNDQQAAARRLTEAWQNSRWVIWRVPPRAP